MFYVYDRWNNLQRRNRANLARGPWNEHTIQNNAATIEKFYVYDRWNILQRMNRANLAPGPWNEHTTVIDMESYNYCYIILYVMFIPWSTS
jgi:hypothetical protein